MSLKLLEIYNFRNLETVKITPLLCGFNFLFGKNGSGKTSFLEAINYLSLGRSFRSSVTERIIQQNVDKLSIFGNVVSNSNHINKLGLERDSDGGLKLRINDSDAQTIADMACLLPVQILDTNCHHLLDSGPIFRRKYLDWGVFYLMNDYLRCWKHFERALKQRNAGLRERIPRKELSIWTHELIDSAEAVNHLREQYITALIPLLQSTVAKLLTIEELQISYFPGWEKGSHYAQVLADNLDRDYQLGYTSSGPHKADFKVIIRRTPAKDILSRGQQKLFVCAMILARGILLFSRTNKKPIYLVDDLPSELDEKSRASLITLLSEQETQIFVTATESKSLTDLFINEPMKMFHVEHGNVCETS